MIVCVCHRISDRDIVRHARAGMDFEAIQMELRVATQCGRCEGCARDVVAQCNTERPVAAIERAGAPATPWNESVAWHSSQASAAA